MKRLKTFTKGVLFGGIVGAVAGLFSAPKKGEELKKDAKRWFKAAMKKKKELERKAKPLVKKAQKEGGKVVKKAQKTIKKYRK